VRAFSQSEGALKSSSNDHADGGFAVIGSIPSGRRVTAKSYEELKASVDAALKSSTAPGL